MELYSYAANTFPGLLTIVKQCVLLRGRVPNNAQHSLGGGASHAHALVRNAHEQDGKKQRKDTKSEFVAKQFVKTILSPFFNLVWTCSGSS